MKPKFDSKVVVQRPLPRRNQIKDLVGGDKKPFLIFDKVLLKNASIKHWIEKYDLRYGVTAGEGLKSLDRFSLHLRKIMKLTEGTSRHQLVFGAVGGGSVGDFAGFLASVYKRGVDLVHVPSTFLAAIDSAHGGKTALNIGDIKNQIGTFYPAKAVIVCESLLANLPPRVFKESLSELAKVGLIQGRSLFAELSSLGALTKPSRATPVLQEAIEAKYQVVAKDPFEVTGERYKLNLGHTFGHIIERKFQLSHGKAVGLGLVFALEYSRDKGLLNSKKSVELTQWLDEVFGIYADSSIKKQYQLTKSQFMTVLKQDKKRAKGDQIDFVFLRGPGRLVIEAVPLSDMLNQAKQTGWVKG